MTGQLGVEAGLEEPWVTVRLHQVENLLLRQLEGGGANTKAQALIGCLSDGRVHIDLEKKQLCHMTRWTNMFDYSLYSNTMIDKVNNPDCVRYLNLTDCNDIIVGGFITILGNNQKHTRPIAAQTHATCLAAVVEIKWS